MQLVEQGRLDLDAPVENFWPEFRIVVPFDDGASITLRQLMCHRSGLVRESPMGGYFDPTEPSIDETVASLADCVLVHHPNTVTKYSNIGVTVVGHTVAEVSGQSFADYQQTHVLGPIGMTHSGFFADESIRDCLATSYMQVADGRGGFSRIESPVFELGTVPAGNLYTSAEDLAKFLVFLFAKGSAGGEQIVQSETLETMFTPQLVETASGFGLGFHIDLFRDRKRVSHMGAVYGFTSSVAAIPELKIGVVVLANEDIASGPVRKLSDAALGWMMDARIGPKTPSEHAPEDAPEDVPEDAHLDSAEALLGDYESASYWAQILLKDESLCAHVSGQEFVLLPKGRDRYTLDGRWRTNAPIEFHRDDKGKVTGFEAVGQTFRRVDPDAQRNTPEAWQRFLASYGPEFIPLVISIKHGHLYAMTENMVDYRLVPVNQTVFNMPEGMYEGEHLVFQVGPDGRVHSTVLAGMLLRRIDP
jgi:CubicO group peptidase (beta-lactamase class C family)